MKRRDNLLNFLMLSMACGGHGSSTTGSSVTSDPLTATNSEETNPTTGLASGSTGGATSGSTTIANGGPVFLSFTANVNQITEGEAVTFTALLTDPDGFDDIIGGSLLSEDELIDYGPFVAAGQDGVYSIALSWSQIQEADPITFENTEIPLVLRARFLDDGGQTASKDGEIILSCASGSACDGSCADLSSDSANCGACGHVCTSMSCGGSICAPYWSQCFAKTDGFANCADACQSLGAKCASVQCNGYTTEYYGTMDSCMNRTGVVSGPDACDVVQDWLKPAIRCCCTDSN